MDELSNYEFRKRDREKLQEIISNVSDKTGVDKFTISRIVDFLFSETSDLVYSDIKAEIKYDGLLKFVNLNGTSDESKRYFSREERGDNYKSAMQEAESFEDDY